MVMDRLNMLFPITHWLHEYQTPSQIESTYVEDTIMLLVYMLLKKFIINSFKITLAAGLTIQFVDMLHMCLKIPIICCFIITSFSFGLSETFGIFVQNIASLVIQQKCKVDILSNRIFHPLGILNILSNANHNFT